jgi:thiosulfate/3-mercaptopyruvate sulfurtransferase
MTYTTLVSAEILNENLMNPDWIIVDCQFSLADAEAGGVAYRHGHLPNARYAHLNQDLSAAIRADSGRHPLPDFRVLAKKLGVWGVTNATQVIAYDNAGGVFAARLWWLLRCMGHTAVAVLDGGLTHWRHSGLLITTVLPRSQTRVFRPYLETAQWLSALQVENALAQRAITLIDARTPERYRGEHEPIDAVAGHIPYALNHAIHLNLDKDGLLLPAERLHRQFTGLIGKIAPEQVVHYCGSGVTACHNSLAMEQAGLLGSKLYAGSWSEWIKNKNRAVMSG